MYPWPYYPPPPSDTTNKQLLEYLLEQEKKREEKDKAKKDDDFIKIPKKKPTTWSTIEVFMILMSVGPFVGLAALYVYAEFIKTVAEVIVK